MTDESLSGGGKTPSQRPAGGEAEVGASGSAAAVAAPGEGESPEKSIAASMPRWIEKVASDLSASLGRKVSGRVAQVLSPDTGAFAALFSPPLVVVRTTVRAGGLCAAGLLAAGQDGALTLAAAKSGREKASGLDDASLAAFSAIAREIGNSLQALWSGETRCAIAVETAGAQSADAPPEGFSAGRAVVAEVSMEIDGQAATVRVVFGDSLAEFLSCRHAAGPVANEGRSAVSLDRILRVSVPVVVEIARRRTTVKEVVSFKPGTVIEFDKKSDDLLELTAGKARIGKGEAVKIGESFGLRVAEVGTVQERIKSLGKKTQAD